MMDGDGNINDLLLTKQRQLLCCLRGGPIAAEKKTANSKKPHKSTPMLSSAIKRLPNTHFFYFISLFSSSAG